MWLSLLLILLTISRLIGNRNNLTRLNLLSAIREKMMKAYQVTAGLDGTSS